MGQGRVELPTSRLSGVRSNHLSYWPRIDELFVALEARKKLADRDVLGPSKLSPITRASVHAGFIANEACAFLRRGALT